MSTKILLSFAMANHGANFANWLRDRLMKQYNLYQVDAVYMDSVVARSGATRHAKTFAQNDIAPEGVASVSLDMRPHMVSPTGARPIGAMKSDWNKMYKIAMLEAQVMIFVYTDEYRDSPWCMKEWGQFHMENGQRRNRRQAPLRGVFLAFNPAVNLVGIHEPHVTRLTVVKTDGMQRGLAWDRGDFVLNESDYRQLVNAIGPIT
ncbi:MAG: hypothetical protein Q8K29_15585 [Polaromonas sp.]|nr:hypothetical protein [Polaromonas sp.]